MPLNRLPHLIERLLQRGEKLQRLGARCHAALGRDQQRVAEGLSQPRQLRADGRLAEVQPRSGLGDVALGQQRFQRDEEVEVEPAGIHAVDGRCLK